MLAYAGSVPLSYHVPPVAVADSRPIASDKDGSRAGAVATRDDATGAGTPDSLDATASRPVPALTDPYALTGPSPAFDANVLDAERDLDAVLARMNASRAQSEMARIAGRAESASPRTGLPGAVAETGAEMGQQADGAGPATAEEDAAE